MSNVNRTNNAYISTVRGKNIIAALASGTPGGPGVQQSVLLTQIISVLDGPQPLAPTNLTFTSAGSAGAYTLSWVNNETAILDTLIEINPGTGWRRYSQNPLRDASSTIITGLSGATQVRVSTISTGNKSSNPSNTVFIITSLNSSIPVPTNLANAGSGTGYGDFILSWTNNAPNIIDTIIEINGVLYNPNRYDVNSPFYGTPNDVVTTWPIYPHAPLGNANSIIVSGYETIIPRIYSVTRAGTSNVVNLPSNAT